MQPILEIKSISKKFRLHQEQPPYLSIRDSVTSFFQKSIQEQMSATKEFWALKNISFDVLPGDSIGVIGKNGAGKSTLLKILSKITPPSEGKIISRGRIASLLEVGTGFHPELSGRENIFLNGSILGMKKKEITSKFDAIVDFSGVERFLDTPLKHYSSGMQLRLAFAVSAFLEPEILLLDEVLAVGDASFQQKCINKMTAISQSGRTILFVSHNLSAVKAICNKAIVLKQGTKVFEGSAADAISLYNSEEKLSGNVIDLSSLERQQGNGDLQFETILFEKENFSFQEPIRYKIKLKRRGNLPEDQVFSDLDIGVAIKDKNMNTIMHLSNRFLNVLIDHRDDHSFYCMEVENNLKPDLYYMTLFLRTKDTIQDWLTDAVQFTVLDGNPYNYSNTSLINGVVLPHFKFYHEEGQ